MKKISLVLLILSFTNVTNVFAQRPTIVATGAISKKEIIGIWQTGVVTGNGYTEAFIFFANGDFKYNYDPSEDTRNILGFKGRYRLVGDQLLITIKTRIVCDGGKIAAGALGSDDFLFVFNKGDVKELDEPNAKELDPLYISKVIRMAKRLSLFINNRQYFKVSSNPNQKE